MNLLIPTRIKRTSPTESFRNQLDRLFNEAFGSIGITPFDDVEENKLCLSDWRPSVEAFEDEEKYTIKAALPGVEKDDIDIQVSENSVSISGERKYENKIEQENLYRSEFSYGKFQRTFQLEKTVDAKNVKAELKNGLLTIALPKTTIEKEKTVKVNIDQ